VVFHLAYAPPSAHTNPRPSVQAVLAGILFSQFASESQLSALCRDAIRKAGIFELEDFTANVNDPAEGALFHSGRTCFNNNRGHFTKNSN
jgi:hypothetical protein